MCLQFIHKSVHYIAIYETKKFTCLINEEIKTKARFETEENICYFNSNKNLIICGKTQIKTYKIKNYQREKKIALTLESTINVLPISLTKSTFKIISLTEDKKNKVLFYSLGDRVFSLTGNSRKLIFSQNEHDFVKENDSLCKYNDFLEKLIITSSEAVFFLDLKKIIKNIELGSVDIST